MPRRKETFSRIGLAGYQRDLETRSGSQPGGTRACSTPRTVPDKIQDLLKGRPNTCCSSWIRVKVWEGERREEEGTGKEGFIVGRKKTAGFSEPCQNSPQPHHLAKEIVSVAEKNAGHDTQALPLTPRLTFVTQCPCGPVLLGYNLQS